MWRQISGLVPRGSLFGRKTGKQFSNIWVSFSQNVESAPPVMFIQGFRLRPLVFETAGSFPGIACEPPPTDLFLLFSRNSPFVSVLQPPSSSKPPRSSFFVSDPRNLFGLGFILALLP